MQAPPPVPNLLIQLATMATNVHNSLAQTEIDWKYRPSEDEWSLTEVVCHLRDVEVEVHQARYAAIIAQENSFLAGVSADEWAQERAYQNQDGRAALVEFVEARKRTLDLLQDLPKESWSRLGRHSFLGPTTLHEILFLQTRHDDIHLEQIRSLLAAQMLTMQS